MVLLILVGGRDQLAQEKERRKGTKLAASPIRLHQIRPIGHLLFSTNPDRSVTSLLSTNIAKTKIGQLLLY